ncbi:RNA-binding domain-containing protein [Armillaria gallica]|uniref:RNA-binding domain-containing protein n=1 Tax=Armillaria gallica TaxID=47427 RepID=A0A2H3E439_ARMGA|nr:RNA-binding domain-containing protein [Armillaria gallica]
MSEAQVAQVAHDGAPPVTQDKEETGFKVFAGNLAYATTDEGLKAFFAPVQSDVLSAQVILRGTRSAGYGFVALATEEAAIKAVEALDKTELDGRQVIIEIAKPSEQKDKERKERKAKRRPGRRGSKAVPGEVTEAEANGEVTVVPEPAAAGTDEAAKPKKKKKNTRKNKAKAAAEGDVETPAPAVEGEAAAEAVPKKKARKPRAPRTARPAGEDPVGEPSGNMLFVANLGFNIDDDGLKGLFTEVGINVVSARIVHRRWGQPRRSKGYGFVDVGGEEEQKEAIAALDGKEVGGRNIAVKIAVNTPHDDAHDESRYQREVESREEGLSKSLFTRAKEEQEAGIATGNKAMSIMMKMGFKPGQSLGKTDDEPADAATVSIDVASSSKKSGGHKVEPLPLNEWEGRKGIGTRKRGLSPTAAERMAKMAKMAETAKQSNFRDRAMQEYAERRAEGRLLSAQRTCANLDEKADIKFNILNLNPNNPESFPHGLMDALELHTTLSLPIASKHNIASVESRLRQQMQSDALQPLDDVTDQDQKAVAADPEFPPETLEESAQYLRLQAQDRLELILAYLRDRYLYCFWCGTQYHSHDEMSNECPGPDEDDH